LMLLIPKLGRPERDPRMPDMGPDFETEQALRHCEPTAAPFDRESRDAIVAMESVRRTPSVQLCTSMELPACYRP